MAKDKSDKLNKVKLIIGIIVGLITIGGVILAIDKYFAKSEDTEKTHIELKKTDELLSERLDMAITEDAIDRQKQDIQQMKNYHIFEQKAQQPQLTPMEEEVLKKAEERLKELEEEKKRKVKVYEEMRKK